MSKEESVRLVETYYDEQDKYIGASISIHKAESIPWRAASLIPSVLAGIRLKIKSKGFIM